MAAIPHNLADQGHGHRRLQLKIGTLEKGDTDLSRIGA